MKRYVHWTKPEIEYLREAQSVGLPIDSIVKEHKARFPNTPRTRRAIISKIHANGFQRPDQTKRHTEETERIYRLRDACEYVKAVRIGDTVPVICPWEKMTGSGAAMKNMEVVKIFPMKSGTGFLMQHPVGKWKMTCTYKEMLEAVLANI